MIIDPKQEQILISALDKRNSGRGLKNSEKSLLYSFDRARQHGESIMVRPVGLPEAKPSGAKPNIPSEDVEGLNSRLRQFGSSSGPEGDAIGVVGGDGKLNLVPKHSTWVTPTTYPTAIGQTDGNFYFESNSTGAVFRNFGTSPTSILTINAADLTKNMSIKEIDVCVGGVNKKMLIIASDPY